jgi:hypothetical protein
MAGPQFCVQAYRLKVLNQSNDFLVRNVRVYQVRLKFTYVLVGSSYLPTSL